MAQVLIINVDDVIVGNPKARAKRNGVSLEAELRDILRRAAMPRSLEQIRGILGKLDKQARGKKFSDSVKLLRKDRAMMIELLVDASVAVKWSSRGQGR